MAFTWFSAGIVPDFDVYTSYVTQYEGMRSGFYIRVLNGGYFIYKILPETALELWASMYVDVEVTHSIVMAFMKTDTTTSLFEVYVENNRVVAYARIDGVRTLMCTGTTILASGTAHTIEVYCKRDQINGAIQVWVDNVPECSFVGNTGSAADVIANVKFVASAGYYNQHFSEIIITNEGRIGKKQMKTLYLSGSGDVDTSDGFMDVMGNTTTTTSTTTKAGTWIIPRPFRANGTLKCIAFTLTTADTVKVGVFTKNAATVAFTPRLSATVACLAGENIINAAIELPVWDVYAGEYVGIWTSAGTLIYTSMITNDDDTSVGSWYNIAGDAFSLGTEQAYGTGSITNPIRGYCQYFIIGSNQLYVYNNNAWGVYERPWQESKRYQSFSLEGQECLNTCTDLTDFQCTAVKAIKVSIRGEAGEYVSRGQISLKTGGGTVYSDVINMPAVTNRRHFTFQGNWTKTQLNTAQIGFKALT